MNQHSLTAKRCPECKAERSLQIDTAAGEVVCTECAVVVHGGLVESEATVFDEDFTGVSIDDAARRAGTTAGGRINEAADDAAKNQTTSRAWRILETLQRRTGVPVAVAEAAMSMFRDFTKLQQQRQMAKISTPMLSCACFLIASELRQLPVPAHEIESYRIDASVTAAALDNKKSLLLRTMPAWDADSKRCRATLHKDLAMLYANRLAQLDQLWVRGVHAEVAVMTQAFREQVNSSKPPHLTCAAMILLAKTKKPAALALGLVQSESHVEFKKLLEALGRVTREKQERIEDAVRLVSDANLGALLAKVQQVKRAAQEASSAAAAATDVGKPPSASSAQPTPSRGAAVKRPREEDEDKKNGDDDEAK